MSKKRNLQILVSGMEIFEASGMVTMLLIGTLRNFYDASHEKIIPVLCCDIIPISDQDLCAVFQLERILGSGVYDFLSAR